MAEAVKSGQVDAGLTWGPHDFTAINNGLAVVIRSRSLSPGHPCCRLVAMEDEIKKNRETLVRFVRALLQAEKYAKEHQKETVDAIVRYVKLDREIIRQAYYEGYLDQASDPNKEGVRNFWQTMQSSEFINSNLDITKYVETGIYEVALGSLAKENPQEPYWKALQKVFAQRDV